MTKHKPTPRVAQLMRTAVLMIVGGTTMETAAVRLGIKPATLRHYKGNYRAHWDGYYAELTDAKALQKVVRRKRRRRGIPDHIKLGIPQACKRLAQGETWEDTAEALDVGPDTMRDWQTRYSDFWHQSYDAAMSAAVKSSEVGPAAARENPLLYDRKILRWEAWSKANGRALLNANGKMTLSQFYEDVYRRMRCLTASPRTIEEARSVIHKFECFTGRQVALCELTDDLMIDFFHYLIDQGRSVATVNKYRATLQAVWRFAHRRKLVDTLPDIEKFREPVRLPTCWTMEELSLLIQAAARIKGTIADRPARVWWVALILVLYDTGLRIGACLQLRREHLRLKDSILFVPAAVQKQKADQRFELHQQTIEALGKLVSKDLGFLFPFPHHRGTLGRRYKKLLRAAGLPAAKPQMFHCLRRTTATMIANKQGKAAATEHLGHSCAKVTDAYFDESKIDRVLPVWYMPRPKLPHKPFDESEIPY